MIRKSIRLGDIGIIRETPAEIILTTFCPDGKPHASVMGVRASDGSEVSLRIFTNTQTFQNISGSKAAVVNVASDAELLVKIALKDLLNFDEHELIFERSACVNAPRLAGADAHVEIEVKDIRKAFLSDEIGTSEIGEITAGVKNIEVRDRKIHPFKRSELYLIESAVLATRVKEALRRGKKAVGRKFFGKLDDILKECRKIAPKSRDLHLITRIANSLKTSLG